MSLDTKYNFAFIDIETTGFDPEIHEIVEIGCVVVERGDSISDLQIVEEFEIKVKPEHIETADPGALRVNGYNETDWMFAYTLPQALELLSKKCKDCVFVAHNVTFDWQFIERAYRIQQMDVPFHYHKLDTLSIAFSKFNGSSDIKHLSLRALCEYFGITNERAHSALPDARATVQVFKKLMEKK